MPTAHHCDAGTHFCWKEGDWSGIKYKAKKHTTTVYIDGLPDCHHNNVNDRIEYIEPVASTSTTLTVKVCGFLTAHPHSLSWMYMYPYNSLRSST
jgi:hypothetical protein